MSATEGVINVGHFIVHRSDFVSSERLWIVPAIAEFRAYRLTANQHLVPAHFFLRHFNIGGPRGFLRRGLVEVRRILIDQFHYKVSIGPTGSYLQVRKHGTR